MGKRVRITNESLNSYGTRVLTSGLDVSQYNRNPVLLYMHERGQVIGLVKDLRVEGSEVTGELVFDEATELSQRCKKQWEFGSLKMVSVGIDILETSEDAQYLVQGQTSPTITKSKLFEVSLVDIGANDDAIVLRRQDNGEGDRHTGTFMKVTAMPALKKPTPNPSRGEGSENTIINQTPKTKEMDKEKLALELGLAADAEESAIHEQIALLQKQGREAESLRKENEELLTQRIEALVDGAVKEQKFGSEKRDHFIELGKKVGIESLKETLQAMSPQVKLADMVRPGSGSGSQEYKKLSDVPAGELAELKQNDLALYKELYKAEYGMEFPN